MLTSSFDIGNVINSLNVDLLICQWEVITRSLYFRHCGDVYVRDVERAFLAQCLRYTSPQIAAVIITSIISTLSTGAL